MFINRKYTYWCLAFCIYSCNYPTVTETINDIETTTLIADTLSDYPYHLLHNTKINGNYLFIINPQDAGEMEVLDLEKNEWISYPEESDKINPDKLSIPISFYQFSKYFEYSPDSLKLHYYKRFRYKNTEINEVVRLDEDRFVSIGRYRQGLFGLIDIRKNKFEYFGTYPLKISIPFDGSEEDYFHLFKGKIATTKDRKTIIYGCRNIAYLSCYHLTKRKKLKFAWEKTLIKPDYYFKDKQLQLNPDVNQGGFLDLCVVNDKIYAGYAKFGRSDSIRSICTFDMSGKQLAVYQANVPLSRFWVSKNEQIYGLSAQNEPVIIALNKQITIPNDNLQ